MPELKMMKKLQGDSRFNVIENVHENGSLLIIIEDDFDNPISLIVSKKNIIIYATLWSIKINKYVSIEHALHDLCNTQAVQMKDDELSLIKDEYQLQNIISYEEYSIYPQKMIELIYRMYCNILHINDVVKYTEACKYDDSSEINNSAEKHTHIV